MAGAGRRWPNEALSREETARLGNVLGQLRCEVGAARVHRMRLGGPGDVGGDRTGSSDRLWLESLVVEVLASIGVDRARVYAYQHVGRLVTVDNIAWLDDTSVERWHQAVERYRRLHP
jgi:hypothetical protein